MTRLTNLRWRARERRAPRAPRHLRHALTAALAASLAACGDGHPDDAPPSGAPGVSGASVASTPRPALFSDTSRAARLVARSIEAHGGWEAWNGIRDLTVYDRRRGYTAAGDTTDDRLVLAYHRSPAWMRLERTDADGTTTVQGYDGETYWATRNGRRLTDPESIEAARFRVWTDQYFDFLPFKLADPGTRFEYAGPEEVDGRRLERVRVRYGAGVGDHPDDVYTYAFDAEDGTLARFHFNVTAVDADFHELVAWTDTEWMEGLLRPRRTRAWDSDAERRPVRLRSEHVYDSIRVDRGLDRSFFAPPEPGGAGGR